MFPTILIANNQKTLDTFVEHFKKEQGFSEAYSHIIVPEKTALTINQIRELKKGLIISSAKPRLIIFHSFDSATLEAQNALLKVLEEQNSNNQFIMYVSQVGNILPTIISRSRIIDLEEEKPLIDENTTNQIDAFLENPSLSYLSSETFTVTTKEQAALVLKICLERLRIKMKSSATDYTGIIKKTFKLLYKLEHNNLSPQLTIDNWIITVVKSKV